MMTSTWVEKETPWGHEGDGQDKPDMRLEQIDSSTQRVRRHDGGKRGRGTPPRQSTRSNLTNDGQREREGRKNRANHLTESRMRIFCEETTRRHDKGVKTSKDNMIFVQIKFINLFHL
ncbi:carbonate dehydratase [Anopheles sinensis]|uniref:Carbonate dehydratase n=1 Tax=Anopheles sinensis TaxID=74873 RepID=A0A084WLH0_ANOSI|nr:carbonate dehydratase [Anopheles sinensis]